jgi:integrase
MSNILVLPVKQTYKPVRKRGRLSVRKDGRFQATKTWTDGRGIQHRKTFYGKTQKEAKEKRELFAVEMRLGRNVSNVNQTLSSYIDIWLKNKCDLVERNTFTDYRRYANNMREYLGRLKLSDITLSDVQSCLNRKSGKSESTIKTMRFVMRSIFETAKQDRLITFNPCDGLKLPCGTSGTHRILESSEVERITYNQTSHRFALAIIIMLYAGLRRGEVLALEVSDIDLKENVIHVWRAVKFEGNKPIITDPKTKAGFRDVPIMPPLAEAIKRLLPNEGRIARNARGKIMTKCAFRRALSSYMWSHEKEINGLRTNKPTKAQKQNWTPFEFRCHDLRHTFCTYLFDAGVDVQTAKQLMGHDDIAVTMGIYTHLSKTRKARSVDSLTEFFLQNKHLNNVN